MGNISVKMLKRHTFLMIYIIPISQRNLLSTFRMIALSSSGVNEERKATLFASVTDSLSDTLEEGTSSTFEGSEASFRVG